MQLIKIIFWDSLINVGPFIRGYGPLSLKIWGKHGHVYEYYIQNSHPIYINRAESA